MGEKNSKCHIKDNQIDRTMSKVLSLKKQHQNDAILKQQSYTNKAYMYTVYASTFVEAQCQLSCMSLVRFQTELLFSSIG